MEPRNLLQAMNLEMAQFVAGGGSLLTCNSAGIGLKHGPPRQADRGESFALIAAEPFRYEEDFTNEGAFRERSSGHWAIVIDLHDANTGKRKRKWHSFAGTKRGARPSARG